MTANISSQIAMDMIVAAVEKQTGKQVTDIRIDYEGDKFIGFRIMLNSESIHKAAFKPSKEFIVETFGVDD